MSEFSSKCDKFDYLIAAFCGLSAGIIDIFFVGEPKLSSLGSFSDNQTDYLVKKFAKFSGWSPRAGNEDSIASAIGFLEKKFAVNYDQKSTFDVGGAFNMAAKNHHLKSLSHCPDFIGLFFSIMDQFQGKSSFLSDGKLFRIETQSSMLYGNNLAEKMFCGFYNWIGHLMSDVAGSSGNRGSMTGRGSGIPIPFFELFQLCDFGSFQVGNDRQTLATVMTRVFQEGYDLRFAAAMSVPLLVSDMSIKLLWTIRQRYFYKKEWNDCIPSPNSNDDLRIMLLVGNATLCLVDGADAFIRSGGNPIKFILRLNIIAWFKLLLLILKEINRRFNVSYKQLRDEIAKINIELDKCLKQLKSIDFEAYEKEVEIISNINKIFENDDVAVEKMYSYFDTKNIPLQFHNFEEFDKKMKDPDFVLKI